jgi:phage virion morphogenesis protein
MLEIWGNTQEITQRLQEILGRSEDLRPLLLEIGEDETVSTKHRFDTLTAPDGTAWQANSTLVIERKGHNRPLTGKTGLLHHTIDYQVLSDTAVEIGSPMAYAKVQQFGGLSFWEEYEEWWKVPPRQFIGLSREDADHILFLTEDYLL